MLTEPGIYNGVQSGKRGLQQKDTGVIQLAIECIVPDGSTIAAYENIVLKDGSLSTRTIDNLRKAVGWDGVDIDALVSDDWPTFQIVVADEEWNGKTKRKVKWINPDNCGSGAGVDNDNSALARLKSEYGAKLRALSGGSKPTPPKSAPPKPPAPPAAKHGDSTMEEVWELFCDANEGKPEGELYDAWDKMITKVISKAQDDLTPADWGTLKNRMEMDTDDLPF